MDGKNRSLLLEGGYIRRYSTSPILPADLNLTSVATLGSLGNVVIDTMAPKVTHISRVSHRLHSTSTHSNRLHPLHTLHPTKLHNCPMHSTYSCTLCP